MKNNKWFESEIKEARGRLTFLTEEFVVNFVNQVCEMMEKKGISQTDLSTFLNKKPSYISRILNAPHNITAKTMVNFAMALSCELEPPRLIEKEYQPYNIPNFYLNKRLKFGECYSRGDENDNTSAKAA